MIYIAGPWGARAYARALATALEELHVRVVSKWHGQEYDGPDDGSLGLATDRAAHEMNCNGLEAAEHLVLLMAPSFGNGRETWMEVLRFIIQKRESIDDASAGARIFAVCAEGQSMPLTLRVTSYPSITRVYVDGLAKVVAEQVARGILDA